MVKRKYSLKAINVILVMFIAFMLSSCDAYYEIYHSYIREGIEVTNAFLIEYPSLDDLTGKPAGYIDTLNIEKLEHLDKDHLSQFLIDLEEVGGIAGKFEEVADYPSGYGIMLVYSDGGITVSTVDPTGEYIFVGDYNNNNEVERFYGIAWQEMIDEFYDLLDTYFEYELTE